MKSIRRLLPLRLILTVAVLVSLAGSASATPSPAGTVVNYAGPTLTDENGNVYALSGAGYGSFTILVNGSAISTPSSPGQILFYTTIVYYQDT